MQTKTKDILRIGKSDTRGASSRDLHRTWLNILLAVYTKSSRSN